MRLKTSKKQSYSRSNISFKNKIEVLSFTHKDQYYLFHHLLLIFSVKIMLALSEDNFKVLIRVRPLNARQKQEIQAYELSHSKKMRGSTGKSIKMTPSVYSFYTKFYNCNIDQIIKIQKRTHTISVADPQYKNTDRRMKPYTFSGVYDVQDKNSLIFHHDLREHVSTVLEGYNCTVLAYGITGSGKTYTVFGPSIKKSLTVSNFNTFNTNFLQKTQEEIEGISYLIFQHLIKQKSRLWSESCTKVTYKLSFIQIYNQNVRDLLSTEKQKEKFLNVVEDSKGNTTVADVIEVSIQNLDQIYHYINIGTAKRVIASTMANQYSSRSHAILQFSVQVEKKTLEKTFSKLYVIDLAGSEKIQTLNTSKKMLEGANINRSLLALGNCINLLAENSRKNSTSHIPYRDSKLTRLLKDSLGGNTKTIMIACISPNPFLIEETITTLNYAIRAQGIKKKIIKNEVDYEREEKDEFICMKCKRNIENENQLLKSTQFGRQNVDALRDITNNDQRKTIQLGSNQSRKKSFDKRKFQQRLQFLENLYEDIVNNVKQSESIKQYGNGNFSTQPEWLKIQCINQQQRIRLKQILFNTFKNICEQKETTLKDTQLLYEPKGKTLKLKEQVHKQKENNEPKSLSQSKSEKSRRRRSHNKFEIVKKPENECRIIDFQ